MKFYQNSKYAAAHGYITAKLGKKAIKNEKLVDSIVEACYTMDVHNDARSIDAIAKDVESQVRSSLVLGWFGWWLISALAKQIIYIFLRRLLSREN
jgi:hypothetical protein